MPRNTPIKKQEAMFRLGNIFINHSKEPRINRTISEYYVWCKQYKSPQTFHQTKRLFRGLL